MLNMMTTFSTTWRDVLIIIVASLTTWIVAGSLDLAELWIDWAALGEHYQLDEIIFVLLVACFGLMWFGRRRYVELKQVLDDNLLINRSLEAKRQEVESLLTQNRAFAHHVTLLRESERNQLAIELHDVFGQYLAAIDVNASVGLNLVAPESKIHQILTTIHSSTAYLRNVTRSKLRSIKPPGLETVGLSASLKDLVSQWQSTMSEHYVELQLDIDDDIVPYDIALTIYRCLQEGLVNIGKHADATEVVIQASTHMDDEQDQKIIKLMLTDNGRGFHASEDIGKGLGLIGMRERVIAFSGEYHIKSVEPTGMAIYLSIPFE